MKKRDLTIDIAKGICIYLVVLGHCHNAGFIRHYIYLFHMPFFFFVSGFFFNRKDGFINFLKAKIKRLLIPFFIYWLFSITASEGFGILQTKSLIIPDMHIGSIWFLISLWNMYVIHYFVSKLSCIWGGISSIISLGIAYYLVANNVDLPLYLTQTFMAYPFFILGSFFYKNKVFSVNGVRNSCYEVLQSRKVACTLFIIALLFMSLYPFEQLDIKELELPNVFSLLIGAFSGIFMIIIVSGFIFEVRFMAFIRKALSELGKYSIHILGLHVVVLTLAYYIVTPLIIRIEKILMLPVQTGEDIKFNSPYLAIFMAVWISYISMKMGEYSEKKWPKLWGIQKHK